MAPHRHHRTAPAHRRSRWKTAAAATVGLLASASLPFAAANAAPDSPTSAAPDRSSFTFAVLPDTQFYSRYASTSGGEQFQNRYGSEPFSAQTAWLVDHADDLKIPFVVHVGDIVDRHSQTSEWEIASDAMAVLENGGLPYSILAGNHDVSNGCESPTSCSDANRSPDRERYDDYFPTSRAATQSTFGGRDASGYHEWHTFAAEGREFLVLSMSWQPSDAAIAWARGVLAANPTLPAILVTHQLLSIAGDGVSPLETRAGERLWNELIRGNDQIFLTVNGHYHGNSTLRKTNDFGNSVDQIVLDLQMDYMGGNGYLGLLEFDFTNDVIDTTVVSPWVRTKPVDTLVADFDFAVRNHPNSHLRLPIDWDDRFSGFATPKPTPAPVNSSLIAAAEAAVLDGYTEPEPGVVAAPHDADDYPKVDGTVAHWRFGDLARGTLAPGAVVPDERGLSPLTRAGLSGDARAEDVQVTSDHAFASSDPASVCFANASDRTSYLQTALDAPANAETFPNGYTIETFVKLNADWTATTGQWTGPLTRASEGGGDPIMGVAISNLREIQWISNPNHGSITAWSGEVMNDTWLHLAGVSAPDGSLTLYVNGAPVLRNTSGGVGSMPDTDDAGNFLPWLLGTSTWAGEPTEGWQGCIGETRLVDRVLASNEWLTARTYVGDQGSQSINVVVPELAEPGEFVWTIDGDPNVTMTTAASAGSHLRSTGAIAPVMVTDTRLGGQPWSLAGQLSDFNGGLDGKYLGWTPVVMAPGAGATAGAPVESGIVAGDGLTASSTLASATAGHDTGTATLGAYLDLRVPLDTPAGQYRATLTLTALS